MMMMTSSNGNIFCVTGPLCREFTGEFPAQRPVMWSFDVFLRLNKQLSELSWGWWFEMPLHSLWCHCNVHQISLWLDQSSKNYNNDNFHQICNLYQNIIGATGMQQYTVDKKTLEQWHLRLITGWYQETHSVWHLSTEGWRYLIKAHPHIIHGTHIVFHDCMLWWLECQTYRKISNISAPNPQT